MRSYADGRRETLGHYKARRTCSPQCGRGLASAMLALSRVSRRDAEPEWRAGGWTLPPIEWELIVPEATHLPIREIPRADYDAIVARQRGRPAMTSIQVEEAP